LHQKDDATPLFPTEHHDHSHEHPGHSHGH
jgi:hypothetical protein